MQTAATGTVRSNRKGLPKQCIKAKLRDQEVCERRKGPLLCVSYKDKTRQPNLLSTDATSGYREVTSRRNVVKLKSNIVCIYNKVMGGVDLKDTKLYAYLAERRTMKWSTKVFFSLLGTSVLNAFILYKKNASAPRKLRRHEFIISLVHALVENYRPKRQVKKRRTQEQLREARARLNIIEPPTHAIGRGAVIHKILNCLEL